jgi:MFS family permease
VSYATVLNTHAPAAALILVACGSLFHGGMAQHRGQSHGWLTMAGLAASLAAVIDFAALAFLFLLVLVILAMHWPTASRVGGVLWYGLGALPPLALHVALMMPVTGDLRPGFLHQEAQPSVVATTQEWEEDEEEGPSWMAQTAGHLVDGLIGRHGLFSHFPILLLGLAGIGVVMRRHWPNPTKMLAMVTLAGAVMIVGIYSGLNADWDQPMFAVRWFVPFLPLVVYWSGVWLRERHHPALWAVVGVLLGFSVLTTLIGATAPFTQGWQGEYTAYAAARQLFANPHPVHVMANHPLPMPAVE